MKKLLVSIFILISTSACGTGDLKSAIGINKNAPDEFHVISNPPLSVPPSFDLKEPGEDSYQTYSSYSEDSNDQLDKSEERFLENISTENRKTKEMKIIDEEYKNRQKKLEGNSVTKALNYIGGNAQESVIDPVKEKARIASNIENGKLINEGEVYNKNKSTLNRILNN